MYTKIVKIFIGLLITFCIIWVSISQGKTFCYFDYYFSRNIFNIYVDNYVSVSREQNIHYQPKILPYKYQDRNLKSLEVSPSPSSPRNGESSYSSSSSFSAPNSARDTSTVPANSSSSGKPRCR